MKITLTKDQVARVTTIDEAVRVLDERRRELQSERNVVLMEHAPVVAGDVVLSTHGTPNVRRGEARKVRRWRVVSVIPRWYLGDSVHVSARAVLLKADGSEGQEAILDEFTKEESLGR